MAQLPPKAATMSSNWPGFDHPGVPSVGTSFPAAQPSWVEEFLDFSSARRGAHRRSASDSATFFEPPIIAAGMEDDRRRRGGVHEFERLDDEQLLSMFSDEVPPAPSSLPGSSSNTSIPSDQNSVNEEKTEVGSGPMAAASEHQQEAQSVCKAETAEAPAPQQSPSTEQALDPRRVRRILANRQSAQRSRVRKLQYISDLERSVTSLQNEVSALSPRVAFLDHQRSLLTVGNSALKQRIAALSQDKIFKDAHQEALRKEIERLREVYRQQNLKKTASGAATAPPTSHGLGPGTEGELLS